jgi:hypothetical protein
MTGTRLQGADHIANFNFAIQWNRTKNRFISSTQRSVPNYHHAFASNIASEGDSSRSGGKNEISGLSD